MPHLPDLFPDVDQRFARVQRESRVPGVAWGVIRDGELVHAGGAGTIRDGEDRLPDAGSVFRIASMTKSFTAATILLLRDEGQLRLDDPVAAHVRELDAWRPPTKDSPPVTLRQLLTMSAGLPTDDPWGDRQQGLALDRFAELLAAGLSFAWPPGTTFDYSNLGYGILGRVITAAAGAEYREVVHDRLLRPLGMTSTTYLAEDVPAERLAYGYVRRGDALVREGTDGYGALASMGGVYSTVRDLASWVAGFLDAFPARDDPEGPHPLRRSSRREMQQVQRADRVVVAAQAPDAEPAVTGGGYGFGLFVLDDLETGTMIGHAGGYPGFGSYMAWHPATGLGIVALGNLRYAPMRPLASDVLATLVRADAVPRHRVRPLPETAALRPIVDGLIDHWDDAMADRVFAMNMDLDEPREARRASVAAIVGDLSPFRADGARPATSDSPAQLTWWLRGSRGWLRVSILITPEPSPRIQTLGLHPVGDPSPAICAVAERLVAGAAPGQTGPWTWPRDLDAGPDLDVGRVERELRAAPVRLGSVRLGRPMAGDGRSASTFELEADRGRASLKVGLDPQTGVVTTASLLISERSSPPEPW